MIVGVPKETFPGERRVALVPTALGPILKAGLEVIVESGAGEAAGFPDAQYVDRGATIAADRAEVFSKSRVVCQVRTLGANPDAGRADLDLMQRDQVLIGLADPLDDVAPHRALAERGVTAFALELVPRITRAQSMDVLSSQATVAGYEAVLLAAEHLPKMMPMMMTAAGTLAPAKAFIVGAGVAGLQAIATSRRMGAVVSAYDVRPVVKEQVESLGAKFVEMALDAAGSEDKGGYATAMDDDFYRRQRELMTQVVADSDIVITTAAIPGRRSPVLVTAEMVDGMTPGSVIVDLAAERGGNCELTQADETIVVNGVTIMGPTDLPTRAPYHASQMFAKNVATFLLSMINEGELSVDMDDEVIEATLLTRDGEIVQRRVREIFKLDAPAAGVPGGAGGDA